MNARKLAAAIINERWVGWIAIQYNIVEIRSPLLTSLELKVRGSGARLGPLQNGWPVVVVASFGRLNKSCWIALLYLSSKSNLAQTMHASNVNGFWVTRDARICSACSACCPEYLMLFSR